MPPPEGGRATDRPQVDAVLRDAMPGSADDARRTVSPLVSLDVELHLARDPSMHIVLRSAALLASLLVASTAPAQPTAPSANRIHRELDGHVMAPP